MGMAWDHDVDGRVSALGAVWALLITLPFGLAGCVSTQVEDIRKLDTVPMNRVVPYPDAIELEERTVSLSVRHDPAPGLGEAAIGEAREWVRGAVEEVALAQGARIDGDGWAMSDAAPGWGRTFDPPGAFRAMALTTRFLVYGYTAEWKRPFKFLWQTEDEVAEKPGSCLHRAEVSVELRVQRRGDDAGAARIFALEHAAEESTKSLDPACPMTASARSALFETAMKEALGCLRQPLSVLFAPRGHITAHVRDRESDRHLYRASLGSAQGIEPGEALEVRREQRSVTPEGDPARTERVLAVGWVSDEFEADSAWLVVDPADVGDGTEAILDGDVVRPRLEEGLLSSLSGPSCDRILSQP